MWCGARAKWCAETDALRSASVRWTVLQQDTSVLLAVHRHLPSGTLEARCCRVSQCVLCGSVPLLPTSVQQQGDHCQQTNHRQA